MNYGICRKCRKYEIIDGSLECFECSNQKKLPRYGLINPLWGIKNEETKTRIKKEKI